MVLNSFRCDALDFARDFHRGVPRAPTCGGKCARGTPLGIENRVLVFLQWQVRAGHTPVKVALPTTMRVAVAKSRSRVENSRRGGGNFPTEGKRPAQRSEHVRVRG